jgi:hypothetical protein
VVDGRDYWAGVKAGSVIEFNSVRVGVAAKIGVAPR